MLLTPIEVHHFAFVHAMIAHLKAPLVLPISLLGERGTGARAQLGCAKALQHEAHVRVLDSLAVHVADLFHRSVLVRAVIGMPLFVPHGKDSYTFHEHRGVL